MLSTVLKKYSEKYEHEICHNDYYLYWLENDILLALNDNCAIIAGIKPNLRKAYPNINRFQIIDKLNENKTETDILKNIEYLWNFLPNNIKDNFVA